MRQRDRQTAQIRRGALRRAGFTLVEIMVVVIILGILAVTIIPQFGRLTQDAKVTAARGMITVLEKQLEMYYLHMDRYPTTEEGLKALLDRPADGGESWKGPYIKELELDPWKHEYRYKFPGDRTRTYDLWSTGSDGADGGDGLAKDIGNWREE